MILRRCSLILVNHGIATSYAWQMFDIVASTMLISVFPLFHQFFLTKLLATAVD